MLRLGGPAGQHGVRHGRPVFAKPRSAGPTRGHVRLWAPLQGARGRGGARSGAAEAALGPLRVATHVKVSIHGLGQQSQANGGSEIAD